MRCLVAIPRPLAIYAEWHQVEPHEYVQFILDEKGREVAFWLIEEACREEPRRGDFHSRLRKRSRSRTRLLSHIALS